MVTLDGVIQGPGSPEEDPSGSFEYGGWVAPYDDDSSDELMKRLMKPSDLLLGRKTFEIWENFWPQHASEWPGINEVNKYVLSNTRYDSPWSNTFFIKDLDAIKKLKADLSKGTETDHIQVWGSGELIQLLLQHDLVDELWLMIHPLTLGKGKKLFTNGPIPAAFELVESKITTSGVIMANYKRAGAVKTGTVGA